MAYTDPNAHVFVTGEIMTAANFKTYVSDDIVANRNGMACFAYKTSTPAIPSAGFQTASFEANSYDNAGIHSTAALTDRFTIPVAGVWDIIGSAKWDNPSVGADIQVSIQILLNGSLVLEQQISHAKAAVFETHQCPQHWKAAVSDYFSMQVWQNAGVNVNLLAATCKVAFLGANN